MKLCVSIHHNGLAVLSSRKSIKERGITNVTDLSSKLVCGVLTVCIRYIVTDLGFNLKTCTLSDKTRACRYISLGCGNVINSSCTVINYVKLTCTLTVHCVSNVIVPDSELRSVNGNSAGVTAVLTVLNHRAGKTRAVLNSKITAVVDIVACSNVRIINYNVSAGSCEAELSNCANNGILNINVKGRIHSACRSRKSELICKFNDTVSEVDVEGIACSTILAGSVTKLNISVGYVEGSATAGDGNTAGNDKRRLSRRSGHLCSLCITDRTGDVEGVAPTDGHTACAC